MIQHIQREIGKQRPIGEIAAGIALPQMGTFRWFPTLEVITIG
ncbi:hypothetical protein [Insolitispirillum peregrinum]|nr:hypothetical protein [Insolitispirillum peregrinum]